MFPSRIPQTEANSITSGYSIDGATAGLGAAFVGKFSQANGAEAGFTANLLSQLQNQERGGPAF